MRNLVKSLLTCATIALLQGCSSESMENAGAGDNQPQSSGNVDVFNSYIAPTLSAAAAAPGNAANLFDNTGFENGLAGWNACSPAAINTSTDSHTGSAALALSAESCFYRSINVNPGEEFHLSCYVKLAQATGWTGMGLGFTDSNYEELSQSPVAVVTSTDYVQYKTSGVAPSNTASLSMWLYSESGATVDDCQLTNGTTTATEETQNPAVNPIDTNNNGSNITSIRSPMLEGYGEDTTGGAGGQVVYASTGTEINAAMCARATDDTPLIIMVDGTINHSNTTRVSGSCDTQDDEIQFKRVSNISLIGVGNRGVLDQIGVHLREASNIIIQNLHIKNVKKSGSPTSNNGDAIGMESGVSNVWVDHNTLEASGGEDDGYDSLIDLKANTKYVTVSYNHLRNSSRGGLIGSSDRDDENSFITFHHNWYENIQQRTPLLRHGKIHTYNNFWTSESNTDMYHGINARMGSQALVEGNYFFRSNNPLLASSDSDVAGCWEARDNTIEEINYSRSVGNGALVVPEIRDGQLQSTCSVSVPYNYNLDSSTDVPTIVQLNVGMGKIDGANTNQSGSTNNTDTTTSTDNTGTTTEPEEPSSPGSNNNNQGTFSPGNISAACADLVSNSNTNWNESSLQSDQEIIECLYNSLGQAVGFGEGTTGGFNPNGGSKLTVITNNKPEEQILAAISSPEHHWIVFDKDDFSDDVDLMMYRPFCESSSLASDLGLSESQCRDPYQWCARNNVSNANCLNQFFNNELNDSSLAIRNYMIDSNTTIDGRGVNTTFLFNGFRIGADSSGASTHQSENVIITNNRFAGVGHVEDHRLDPDMIRSTGESNKIWIHQNTFDNTGDSAFDIKVGAYDVTVSFNRLINVKRASLHGSSDSRTINAQITSTIHNNLFVTEDAYYNDNDFETLRRIPLMRRGQSHIFNNVLYGYRKDILSVRVGGRVLFDRNMVINNVDQAAANSNRDDLEYFVDNLLRDYRQGGLKVSNSFVWMADSDCQALGAPADLSKSEGSTPDMMSQYSATSRSTIDSNIQSAGQDLADYLFTTAGKGGATPWLVSGAPSIADIISGAPTGCQ